MHLGPILPRTQPGLFESGSQGHPPSITGPSCFPRRRPATRAPSRRSGSSSPNCHRGRHYPYSRKNSSRERLKHGRLRINNINQCIVIPLRGSQNYLSVYRNGETGTHHPRGSKSPQSSLFGLLAIVLPHVGCGGFEGANTPMPALKNGGGAGCDGCNGGVENEGIGLLGGRDIL